MNLKPYLTSQDLLDSIKRRISFPQNQATFTDNDILAMANEEMMISQVPSVLEYHEEYFVYRVDVPLLYNVSRYTIPDRAIGMRLLDVAFCDNSNNLYEMTRVDSGDKAYFQYSGSQNQTLDKFYIENNEIVLASPVTGSPTGSLAFFIFLRPNQLVVNNRAATVQSFSKDILFNNVNLASGDTVFITLKSNSQAPAQTTLTAVTTTVSTATIGPITTISSSLPHGIDIGQMFTVYVSENTGSTPSINGTWLATSTGANSFTIPVATSVVTFTGNIAIGKQFSIGSTSNITAQNFSSTVNATFTNVSSSNLKLNTSRLTYSDITLTASVVTAVPNGIFKDDTILLINFDQLPTTWQDPDTGIISALYSPNALVDVLQTKPGHKTYNYDVTLVNIQGSTGVFNFSDFQKLQSIGQNVGPAVIPVIVGDYICLQNEAIIPQIPPDMHSMLAERTSQRILIALGDAQGAQISAQKIQQMETQQGVLIDNRVDNAPRKVFNRHSILRYGKSYGNQKRG